jgi:putative ABC transport system permease protein
MMLPDRVRRLLTIRFTRQQLTREIDDEIAHHVEQRAQALIRDGMSREEALVEARRRFGDASVVRDRCLDEGNAELRRTSLMTTLDHLRGDLRFALRSLKRAPGYTAVALSTLVVGIGTVTTLASVVYAYALKPLPYRDANRIIAVEEHHGNRGYFSRNISLDAARMIASGSRSFERVTVFEQSINRATIGGRDDAWITLRIDSSFVPLFALNVRHGRNMTRDEIASGAPVALISEVLWRNSLGSDESVMGKPLRLGDELVTVIGVMPEGFRYPFRTDFWRPLRVTDSADLSYMLLAKMQRDVSRSAAEAELKVIASRLARSNPQQFGDLALTPLEMVPRSLQDAGANLAYTFVGAATFVLLIACTNVANLLLVRAAERRGEMAVRSSLGASHRRLMTQALGETVILSVVAGILGTLLAQALIKIALALLTIPPPSWVVLDVDRGVLMFVIALVSLVTLAVGLRPAREATRFDLARALKAGGDGGVANSGVTRSARRTIVVQLALSVVLFVGAALMARTYRNLSTLDVGYPAAQIATIREDYDDSRPRTDLDRLRFASDVAQQVAAIPGVRHTALRSSANLTKWMSAGPSTVVRGREVLGRLDTRVFTDGDTTLNRGSSRVLHFPRYFAISDGYFTTLGLRVGRGRAFASDDREGSTPVVVLSHHFAELLWPGENPVGHVLQFGAKGARITVIGVVDDVRDPQSGKDGLSAGDRSDAYFSFRQVPWSYIDVLAHSDRGIAAVQSAMTDVARRVDPDARTSVSTLANSIESQLLIAKLLGSLLGTFALCGLLLSVIGIYGVIAYGIQQRTREIGIRIALGATANAVITLVMRGSLRLVLLGLGVGLLASLGVTRLIRIALLVSPTDLLTYFMVCLVFGGVAMLACYIPARRVTQIDPLKALRTE